MEKAPEFEQSLKKVNNAFEQFTAFYSQLVEKGIEETNYGKILDEVAQDFKGYYVKAKSHYDALLLNRKQFEEGRIGKDEFERSLLRISEYLIEAEFDIGTRILPRLKRAEKNLLHEEIIQKAETINLPKEMKEEVDLEAKEIATLVEKAQENSNIDQIEEYVDIGNKIIKLGEKLWSFAKKAAPAAVPLIIRIFEAI